ncbi:hypothetical protein PVL29_027292 [Vitis rotundifolia]|uniref:Extradiol ring-cleavage dioxygenase class III enzyme subunit B domain-containing protein n=1 Tax=Vitis rotundifolia TaxID=103349 RepID=A0AA39D4W7_VITRO|nr:hypothetical protein PVL29_027292 [Vitis rotundifolia]
MIYFLCYGVSMQMVHLLFLSQVSKAPGAPESAKRVKELLMASSFKCVNNDKKHGLGHGTWIPFMLMYPEADIQVCQLSIQTKRDGSCVLVIDSGSATHNPSVHGLRSESVSWAYEFNTLLKEDHELSLGTLG